MIKLVISDNEGTTTVVPLVRDQISIGRKEGNTIRLTERNISREHCQLTRSNGSFLVKDLGSYNGVVLNGQRIEGELPVKPGDELRIGDYTLQLQAEGTDVVVSKPPPPPPPPDAEAAPTLVAPLPRTPTPARLVVLTPPLAGAEFTLPERGQARLGRAPELDITIDHRSVSREHATLECAGAEVRIVDASSVNGVVVNHEKVSNTKLAPGDLIEVGDVVLRFVGVGEQFVFDPDQAKALVPARPRSRVQQVLAAVIVVAAVLVALLVVRGGHLSEPAISPEPAAAVEPAVVEPAPVLTPTPAPEPSPEAAFAESLAACRAASEGGRFAEAMAHASAALRAKPDAPEALDCQNAARLNHEQEQIVVRGRAALAAGDTEGAWRELSSLSETSKVRDQPDVRETMAELARARLAEGQSSLHRDPERSRAIAESLLAVDSLDATAHKQAQALLRAAKAAPPPRTAQKDKDKDKEPSPRRTEPREPKARPSAAPSERPSGGGGMEVASACLARGDNACVIRALSGKANTAQELGLLIETYRAVGDAAAAQRSMATYVQRFPTARRAETYRQMLQRQGQ